jgi:hypothetical protein
LTKKNGRVRGIQRFKCAVCGKQFLARQVLSADELWSAYTSGKQTYKQLSAIHGVSTRTIARKLDKVKIEFGTMLKLSSAVIVVDTTYFGRKFGVLIALDVISKRVLWVDFVSHETKELYQKAIIAISSTGCKIAAIVCDGRKGLLGGFGEIPTQMCHFHQIAIVMRYLTKKPKIPAAIDLKKLVHSLPQLTQHEFEEKLDSWHEKWEAVLNERTENHQTKRSFYTHKRLRGAYQSLRRNSKWLFHYREIQSHSVPNTTNPLDGVFADLKNKIRNHNGLSESRKKKFILGFFKALANSGKD